jgi:uncharacterized lipoprotein YmbA
MRSSCTVVALLVMTAACASAPDLSTYTIDMTPSGSVDAATGFSVERFTVSERLDRSRIVIQASPILVESYRTARWAEGLGGMVQRKLVAELGSDEGSETVLVVSGRVVAFEQVDSPSGPRALIRLEIEMRDPGVARYEPPLFEQTYESNRPVDDAGVEPLVHALSRALEDIAAEIAKDAASL